MGEYVVRVGGGEGGGNGDGVRGEAIGSGGVGGDVKAEVFQWAGDAGSEELTEWGVDLDAWREKLMGPFFGWFEG